MKTFRKLLIAVLATCLLSSVGFSQSLGDLIRKYGGTEAEAQNPTAAISNKLQSILGKPIASATAAEIEAAASQMTEAYSSNISATDLSAFVQLFTAAVVQAVAASSPDVPVSLVQAAASGTSRGAVSVATQNGFSAATVAAVAQASTNGAAQGAVNAGLTGAAANAVVLSSATTATSTAAAAGVTVTIAQATAQAPTTPEAPVVINDTPPPVVDNIVQTFNFTIVTVNIAGNNVALAMTSNISDAAATLLSGNAVVGTQITGTNNTFDLSAIATAVLGSGATLTAAQLELLASVVADALDREVLTSGSSSIIVSPSS